MSSPKGYSGSCHCGFVQYQIRLQFPPIHNPQAKSIRIYKCNCTTCQKMGFFHCRPISPEEDFILISPRKIEELGDYRTFAQKTGWYFCKKCGVRVFGMSGMWDPTNIDVERWAGGKRDGDEKLQSVLRTRPMMRTRVVDGKEVTEPYHYVSVNAVTLEPGEDIDLRVWHDKGWVLYMDCKERKGPVRPAKPHEGGMY